MRFTWNPPIVVGQDQLLYQVFTLLGSGRGWRSKMYVTPGVDVVTSVTVEDLPLPEGWSPLKANERYVRIVAGGDVHVRSFAKRPYVRKDGSFAVLGEVYFGERRTLIDQYAVHDGKCVIYAPKNHLTAVDQSPE